MRSKISAGAAVLLLGAAIWVMAARPAKHCEKAVGEAVEVTLDRKIGGAVCGYAGKSIDTEYHKSLYEGADGCRYSITDKRVVRDRGTGQEEAYFYADVGESDSVQGRVEVMEYGGLHCLNEEDPAARADYVQNLNNLGLFIGAIHLHHHYVLKRTS